MRRSLRSYKPMADGLAAAGENRRNADERGESGFVAQTAAVGPEHLELGGGGRPDNGQVEQIGACGGDQYPELGSVLGGLGFEHQRATGDRTESAHGGTVLNAVTGQGAQPGSGRAAGRCRRAQLSRKPCRALTISALS